MKLHYSSHLPLLKVLIPFTVCVFIITNPITGRAAQADLQEIEKQLPNLPDDTVKVNLLIQLGRGYCSIENDRALMFLQEAFTIATANNYNPGIGRSLLWQGRVYYYKDDFDLAIKYLDKARAVLEQEKDFDNLAFLCFAEAAIFGLRGDYIHTLKMYENAIKLYEETGNTKMMSTCYSGIGTVLLNRGDAKKALDYFRESLQIKKQIGHLAGVSNLYTGIGNAYDVMGNLDSALYYHTEALKIRTELKIERAVANSYYHLGGVLNQMHRYKEAESSLLKAKKIFLELEEQTGVIITDLRLANSQNYLKKPGALDLAKQALQMSIELQNSNLESHASKLISEMYAYNENFDSSYTYLLKHQSLHDSLFTAEKDRTIAEMEAKFQSEKKDNDIKLLKSKTEIQRKSNILLIVLIVVFAAVIVLLIFLFRIKSTAFNRQQRLREQENIIHTQEQKLIEKENQILQEQLESKNRELASKALEMLRFNETISSIIERLDSLNSSFDSNDEVVKPIKDIIHELENQTKQNIWSEFEKIFKNIHTGFYDKLLEICPELTATEIKTAALLKLNLTTKEIAAITFKSEGGIKTTRYRLRKKFKLSGDENLVPFLMQI